MQVSPSVSTSNTTVECGLKSPLAMGKSINYILYQTR